MKKILLVLLVSLFSHSSLTQEAPKVQLIKNYKVGKWVNIHEKRNDLLGVKVQQFPDNLYTASDYEGKHPSMIIYVFKSLDVHQIEYNPNGTIFSGFWWKTKKGHPLLGQLKKTTL